MSVDHQIRALFYFVGARTDDRSDFFAAEKPREGIAAGAGELIGHDHLRTVDSDGRRANVFAFARREDREKLALEFFLDHTCRIISFKEEVSSLCEGIFASRFRRAAVCCSAGNVWNRDFCGCRSQDMLPCTT